VTVSDGLGKTPALEQEDATAMLALAQELSRARDLPSVMTVVRRAARALLAADGVTFVLRDGEQVFYADEDAIAPLWKGRRFPASACVSGWAIAHRQTVVIPDIARDPRVPLTVYASTFVKSLLMVPIRAEDPVGAIGAYWAECRTATPREIAVLESLAGFAAIAVANAELNQRAEEAVQARDQWLGMTSHELRTPLTPARLHVEAALRAMAAGREPGELTSKLQRALSSLDRLGRVVERLLDYSRYSQHGVMLEPEPLDLSALAREMSESFADSARQIGAAIEVVSAGPVHGTWDRLRLADVCANLLSNAVTHAGRGPIRVETTAEGGMARLVVRDGGAGIPREHHERVFQAFIRLDPNAQGVGLGLWLARQIVQAHRGRITLDSDPGSGTVVTVELPRTAAMSGG
jgi:signal transduction histidine kinase